MICCVVCCCSYMYVYYFLCFFFFFFFFKQKKGYELCISDWSSDVCSSDLAHRITSPWKWRHLKSVIVPSVQSPPSMLKLHDFCNRAILRIDIARNTAGSARPHIQSVRPGLHRQLYRGECRDRRRLPQSDRGRRSGMQSRIRGRTVQPEQSGLLQQPIRSKERRVGKEWVSKCKYRGAP